MEIVQTARLTHAGPRAPTLYRGRCDLRGQMRATMEVARCDHNDFDWRGSSFGQRLNPLFRVLLEMLLFIPAVGHGIVHRGMGT